MDPITLAALGLAGGLALLFGAIVKQSKTPKPTCDQAKDIARTVGSTAAGASTGASAGPYGAGIGAGLGLALGTYSDLTGPCGPQDKAAIASIGKSACAKADEGYRMIKAAGGNILGYEHMSCSQKLEAVIALGPLLGLVLPAAIVAGGVVGGAERVADNVTNTHTEVGGGHATVGGHKIF